MLTRIILLTGVFWPIIAAAENELSTDNFNYVATISEGKQSLREFELPYEIFAGLQRKDYGDMRIFNAQNQSVPFRVSRLTNPAKQNKIVHSLKFYRLAETKSGNPLQLKFELDKKNSISFSSAETEQTGKDVYLIIENNQQDYPLYKLELQWTPQSTSFSTPVRLEGSTEMQNWFSLRPKTILYDLKHQNTTLAQNNIHIPAGTKAKYLRLTFNDANPFSSSISKIIGTYSQTIPLKNDHWKKLPALHQGDQSNEWLFNTHSLVAVTKIAFDIPQTGLFYQGILYSKRPEKLAAISLKNKTSYKREIKKILHKQRNKLPKEQSDWNYQGTVTQYRLANSSGEIQSPPVSIYPNKDSEWKLVLNQPEILLPDQIPGIKIAWVPVVVTFLAQGKGPFQLYFGSPDIQPERGLLPKLPENNTAEKVNITDINVISKTNESRQSKSYFSFTPGLWQKILLWVLLCLGVALMIFMVYRLFKSIASGNN